MTHILFRIKAIKDRRLSLWKSIEEKRKNLLSCFILHLFLEVSYYGDSIFIQSKVLLQTKGIKRTHLYIE